MKKQKNIIEKNKGYQFNEAQHIHMLDGVPLNGVTTVINKTLAKEALIPWAANETSKYIKEGLSSFKYDEFFYKITVDNMDKLLDEGRQAHRKKKDDAGKFGTLVHKRIENYINGKRGPKLDDMQKIAFNNFKKWEKDNKVEFLESEKHVFSRENWFGGICDLVIKIDGKTYVGDIKTSSNIYREMFLQTAAYEICLNEMGEYTDIVGYVIVNLKKDGKMQVKVDTNTEANKNAFKHTLALYNLLRE